MWCNKKPGNPGCHSDVPTPETSCLVTRFRVAHFSSEWQTRSFSLLSFSLDLCIRIMWNSNSVHSCVLQKCGLKMKSGCPRLKSPQQRTPTHTRKLLSTSIALFFQFLNQRTKRSLYTCQNDTNQWMKIADEECKIGSLSRCSHFATFVGMHDTLVISQYKKKITLHFGYLIIHADFSLFFYTIHDCCDFNIG